MQKSCDINVRHTPSVSDSIHKFLTVKEVEEEYATL